jgi:hypothetical protein
MMSRASHLGAVRAAEDFAVRFHAVADHAAITVAAFRRERVDGALKTVEDVYSIFALQRDFKRFPVFIPADFAACHDWTPIVACGH